MRNIMSVSDVVIIPFMHDIAPKILKMFDEFSNTLAARYVEPSSFGCISDTDDPFFRVALPNHACIFNKIEYIGKDAFVIAYDEKFALVILNNEGIMNFYRKEDISCTNVPIERHVHPNGSWGMKKVKS